LCEVYFSQGWIRAAREEKDKQDMEKQVFPPCNVEWSQEKGSRSLPPFHNVFMCKIYFSGVQISVQKPYPPPSPLKNTNFPF
jgi:hypothetical protein